MLVELSIRDLALIDEAELALGPGLNVLTGETGAGKSLLVGALELVAGETPRGGASAWVRKGAREARVEARFELADPAAIAACRAVLEAELPELARDFAPPEASRRSAPVELVLGRTLSEDGRTRAHVEHRPVALRALRALAPHLLEIHGQNDHQRLLDPAEQLRLLDAYGKLAPALAEYRAARAAWRALRERLAGFEGRAAERHERALLLRFQADELARARLRAGETAELVEERAGLRHAAELQGELARWVQELAGEDGSLTERAGSLARAVERWQAWIARLTAPLEDLRAAEVHLAEAGAALTTILDVLVHDPARLEAVEERLAELERLSHKYRADEGRLLELAREAALELAELEGAAEDLDSLRAAEETARAECERVAQALALARRALAPRLARAVQATLAALGLEKARFAVEFAPRAGEPGGCSGERFGESGSEQLEFQLAANPGEDLAPLRRVASGGEAARIMLALRTVLGSGEAPRALVFDEIDAGVGGRLGPEVGRHLLEVARANQVLCVTHLPAIAALATLHLRIHKEVRAGRTRTLVEPIAGEMRVAEIADMIAGGAEHATARAEARRLLAESAR
jgi:DNA repair protein RecN (Recombination protein N)